ncbi:MAG: phenylalanine--tRNA ligase subunit alpha [Candidatus Saccharimonadales bacterium]|nr:phenylalanine--tRNA ligase subunit alpha [Candidatus Saccharimonadales bacterium]
MSYKFEEVARVQGELKTKFEKLEEKNRILSDSAIRDLFKLIGSKDDKEKAAFGAEVNRLKNELQQWVEEADQQLPERGPIDVTAPFDINTPADRRPRLLGPEAGSVHPISQELSLISDIFVRMGFEVEPSRQLDDEYHMFTSLNFPKDHPARDDYDTFMTEEDLIPPAHTSTMQNRVMKDRQPPIRVVMPGRVYRNEDLDATHEHTFYQVEGVYVDEGITLGDMLGTISTFLEQYFSQEIEFKTQPFYFPFVEPGLEFLIKKPEILKKPGEGESWLEIMGCGMIHPNVLTEAGVDPTKHSGFAFGMGVERLIMLKYGIEDIRHFESGRLAFLRQFGGRL